METGQKRLIFSVFSDAVLQNAYPSANQVRRLDNPKYAGNSHKLSQTNPITQLNLHPSEKRSFLDYGRPSHLPSKRMAGGTRLSHLITFYSFWFSVISALQNKLKCGIY
jgi:hypothetical protein